MGVSFETYLRRRGDVLMRRRHYVPLRRGHDIPTRRCEDVPLRRHWVFHLRRTCDVAVTYKKTSLQRRHDVLLPSGKCPTRKLSQLIDILLKPFLKCIKSFIRSSLDLLHKCPRYVDENTEIVSLT